MAVESPPVSNRSLNPAYRQWLQDFFAPLGCEYWECLNSGRVRSGAGIQEAVALRLRTTSHFWSRYLSTQPRKGRLGGNVLAEPFPELVEAGEAMVQAASLEDVTEDELRTLVARYEDFSRRLQSESGSSLRHYGDYTATLAYQTAYVAERVATVLGWMQRQLKGPHGEVIA